MGSVRLKTKDLHGYRKSRKGEDRCRTCAHFVYVKIHGIGNADLGKQFRCRIMGLNPSIKYRVRPDHVCNEFKLDVERAAEIRPEPVS